MARVLVADDEANVRSFLAEALELDGHEVTQVGDGLEALEVLGRERHDVVLTDIRMPGLSGLDLLRRIEQLDHAPQVIVLTAYGSVDNAVEAMKLGALDYLQKPLGSLKELRAMVSRAAERSTLMASPLGHESSVVEEAGDGRKLSWGSPKMEPVLVAIARVAPAPTSVLLLGESGVGKEIIARRVHDMSPRATGPFVAVNCAAVAESLLESELFGHEKGAFTGATSRHIGWIEQADGGTLFLDEIGEMRFELQAKLLRVLEQRRFQRVGGVETVEVDVRWVAATNRDLRKMSDAGDFRADLYHRLAVFPIRIPPLRRRREDIPPLAEHLAVEIGESLGVGELTIGQEALSYLGQQRWPGNVRELRNTIERASLMATGTELRLEHFEAANQVSGDLTSDASEVLTIEHDTGDAVPSLQEVEREAIVRALAACSGNRKQAAELLGIGVRTLYDKLKRYDIS